MSATLDRQAITLGESATLSLTFNGPGPQAAPTLPAIDSLEVAYVGPSTRMVVVNGQMSSSIAHIFRVTPQKPGEYKIPPITVTIGGQTLSSEPLTLKVGQPTAPTRESVNAGAEMAFMRLVLPRTEVYAGEIFEAELQLHLRQDVQDLPRMQLTAFPAEGFHVGNLVKSQTRQTQLGSALYRVVTWAVPIRALRQGQMTLGPVTAIAVVERAAPNRRRSFFDFGVFGGEQVQVSLATEPQSVTCLPLPAQGVPPGFNGAVGTYSLAATASPTNITVGDPIVIKVQISGRGVLENLALPEQSWSNFKTYPPTSKVETTDALGLQGTKTFEQTVVPASMDVKELPPLVFSFFDPAQKNYRTLTTPAIPLVVRPSGSLPTPAIARAQEQDQSPAPGIVHIKSRVGQLAQITPPLGVRPWFVALQAVPVLVWAGSLAWRRHREKLANNPRLRRKRQVFQIVEDGLVELRVLARENQSERFFATLFRLLQEQLGERLDLPASAITEALIDEHLVPRGAPQSVIHPLRELFEKCNLARYAPVSSSEELTALVPTFEAVVKEVRELEL
jgi:hypothetical protein